MAGHPESTRVLAALCLILAGCRASSPAAEDRLYAELREHVAHRERRENAYGVLFTLGGERSLAFADEGTEDPDAMVQVFAWRLRLEFERDPARRAHWIDEALQHPYWMVRGMAARSAGSRTPGDEGIDVALERTLATEEIGHVLEGAAESYARRHPQTGPRRVFEWLSARGPLWCVCGLLPFAGQPAPEYADVFRSALESDDLDRRIPAARGLLALGLLPSADPERTTAARRTTAEFLEYSGALDRDHGPLRSSSWRELVREAQQATVVVCGEAHASVPGSLAQSALLADLSRGWGGEGTTLLFELPVQDLQAVTITAARALGLAAEPLEDGDPARRTVFERDEQARAGLLQRLRDRPGAHWLVVYGDGHRASFVRALRAQGVHVVSVSTSGTPAMHREAWMCAGTLAIRGRVFRCADGTYFVANEADLGEDGAPSMAP